MAAKTRIAQEQKTATAQTTVQLTAVEGTTEVEKAFEQLRQRLLHAKGVTHYDKGTCRLVSPGDKKACEAFWFADEGFWVSLEDWDPDTYFVSFGNTNPEQSQGTDGKPDLKFIFQGNIKRTGTYKNTAGAFGKNDASQLYYLHSGRMRKAPRFAQLYNGPRAELAWSRGQSDTRFTVGNLAGDNFVSDLISFVIAVIQFITGGSDSPATESFYRNTFHLGVLAEVKTLISSGAQPNGTNVSSVRLKRLNELSSWLNDDANLLDPALDIFVEDRKRERRNARTQSVIGAAITLVLGWVLSSVSLPTLLQHLLKLLP